MLDTKMGDIINDKEILLEMFNNRYVNIVENSTGIAPIKLDTSLDPKLDQDTVQTFLKYYHFQLREIEIKKLAKANESFTFPNAKTEDIIKIKIIKSLNPKIATGPDGIPITVTKPLRKSLYKKVEM